MSHTRYSVGTLGPVGGSRDYSPKSGALCPFAGGPSKPFTRDPSLPPVNSEIIPINAERSGDALESPTEAFLAAFPSIYGPESPEAVKTRLWPMLDSEATRLARLPAQTQEQKRMTDAIRRHADMTHDEATECRSYSERRRNYHD